MLGIGNGYSRTRVSGRGADGVLSFDASTNSASLAEDGDDLSDGVRAEYSGYSRWFPVGGREAGFAPVDLDEMLSSGYGECAPFTQSVDGSVCLVVRTDPNAPIHPLVLWLDPERGMFPRLQRTYDAGGVISEWYVTDFFEVADGTWLPAAGRFWCRGLAQNTDEFRFPFERVMTVVPKANLARKRSGRSTRGPCWDAHGGCSDGRDLVRGAVRLRRFCTMGAGGYPR